MSVAAPQMGGGFDFLLYRFPAKPKADQSVRNWSFTISSFLFITGCLAAAAGVIEHPTSIRHFVPRTFVGGIEAGSEH